jgi:alpha-tubulin suppressor-like RCC1 family protein
MGRSWWLVCVLAVTPLLAGCPYSQSTPLLPLASVAAGAGHSLVLDQAGNAWAWGQDLNGQLGDGSRFSRSTPERVGAP